MMSLCLVSLKLILMVLSAAGKCFPLNVEDLIFKNIDKQVLMRRKIYSIFRVRNLCPFKLKSWIWSNLSYRVHWTFYEDSWITCCLSCGKWCLFTSRTGSWFSVPDFVCLSYSKSVCLFYLFEVEAFYVPLEEASLVVGGLAPWSSGQGLSTDRGHCIVFVGKTLYSQSTFLHTASFINTGATLWHAIYGWSTKYS